MNSIFEIGKISKLNRYIEFLSLHQKDIIICAAVSDTLYNIKAVEKKKLESIGMTELSFGGWIGYIYINNRGKVIVNKRSERYKSISEILRIADIKVELVSKSFRDGCCAKIFVNNIDLAVNWRGLNIVVIDSNSMKLVDSVCFDFFPDTLTPCKRLFCSFCPHFEQGKNEILEKQITRIMPLVRISKKWAAVEEENISSLSNFINLFDEGYQTISIVDKEGKFKKLVDLNQFKQDFPKNDYRMQSDIHIEYEENEENLKRKLAGLFLKIKGKEIPILKNGEIVALGRNSVYFDLEERWDSKQVYRFSWKWIAESVAKEYFVDKKKVLLSSENGFLCGFKEAFSSWLEIEVYNDELLDKCRAGKYDLIISETDIFRKFPIEQRNAHQLYSILLAETLRQWLQERGVGLHFFSSEGTLPGIERQLSNEGELIGGTVGYLRDAEIPYFIVDGSDYDKRLREDQCQPNFHAGRRCVTEASDFTGNTIYFYGQCTAVGYASYSPDKNLESFLQKRLNEERLNYHVINCGTEAVVGDASYINCIYRMMDTPVRRGDQMLVFVKPSVFYGFDRERFSVNEHKLMNAFIGDENKAKKCFVDAYVGHMNVTGYQIGAKYILQELYNDLKNECTSVEKRKVSFLSELNLPRRENSSINKWLSTLPKTKRMKGDVGAIVMRGNPLSKNLKKLIHSLITDYQYLYIFVTDYGESLLKDKEEQSILNECIKGLPVSIMYLGKLKRCCYMWDWKLAKFISIAPRDFDPVYDTYTFVRYIAPHFGINKYIIEDNPSDVFEHRYNILRKEIMLEEGMDWVEMTV